MAKATIESKKIPVEEWKKIVVRWEDKSVRSLELTFEEVLTLRHLLEHFTQNNLIERSREYSVTTGKRARALLHKNPELFVGVAEALEELY